MSSVEIVCREFAELASDYLEGAVPEPMLELVKEHLAMCDWCRNYADQVRATVDAVAGEAAALRTAPPPPTLDKLIDAFRRRTGQGRAP